MPVTELTRSVPGGDILVRSPQEAELTDLLRRRGVTAEPAADGGLAVRGLEAAALAGLAASAGIAIHELTPRHASLEEAFMELTNDSVEYRAGPATPSIRPGRATAITTKES